MVAAGIDVSKAMLDVAIGEGPVYRFANSGPGTEPAGPRRPYGRRSVNPAAYIAWLDQEIAQLDKEYQALLQRRSALRLQATLYRSVPGAL